jgi:periplasmic divalent cation tolerance protein
MDDALLVLTTVETAEDGERLALLLVERKLAACVQILPPMVSIYRWQGKVERASEYLIFIKTTQSVFARLESVIKENHPYETPEIIGISIKNGSLDYLKWVYESVGPG